MEFDKVIENRCSCRNYLPMPISDETIKQIVEAGRVAPSAKNAQPWKFVCIKTDFLKDGESKKIAEIMANYYLENRNDKEKMAGACSVFATSKIIENCPALILIFENSNYIDRYTMESISDVLSIGACVEHMVLKATDLGLGSLWICDTYFVHKELAQFIEDKLHGTAKEGFIKPDNRLVAALALGEPGEPKYNKPRKSMEDILTIINYDK